MAFIRCITPETKPLVEHWRNELFLRDGIPPVKTKWYREGVRVLGGVLARQVKRHLAKENPAYAEGEGVLLVVVMVGGEGLLRSFLDELPEARVGHVWTEHVAPNGVSGPIMYKTDFPMRRENDRCIILDQVAATGSTIRDVMNASPWKEGERSRIQIATLFSSDAAVRRFEARHQFYALYGDCTVAENHMLDPGPGNTGDRWRGIVPPFPREGDRRASSAS